MGVPISLRKDIFKILKTVFRAKYEYAGNCRQADAEHAKEPNVINLILKIPLRRLDAPIHQDPGSADNPNAPSRKKAQGNR